MAKKQLILTAAHEKFCQHYSEYDCARQAFMYAWPQTKFSSAGELASRMLKNVEILERIEHIKEEFAVQYRQTREGNVRDLINTAEEAKAQGQYSAYAKLREMVLRMAGLQDPIKEDNSKDDKTIILDLPGLEPEEEDSDESED